MTLVCTAAAIALAPLAGAAPASADTVPPSPTAKDVLDVAPVDGAPTTPTSGMIAGTTGALFQANGTSYSWLDDASGTVTPVSLPGAVDGLMSADGDQVGVWDQSKNLLQVGSPVSGGWTSFSIPAGQEPIAVHGSEVLVRADRQPSYQLLSYDPQGNSTVIPLQGLPAGAAYFTMSGSSSAIALGFLTPDNVAHWGLADWATGTYHELRSDTGGYPNGIGIRGDEVVVFAADYKGSVLEGNRLYVYPASQVLAGATVPPRSPSVEVPYIHPVQVIGNHLLYFDYNHLTDLPLDGGAPKVLDSNATPWLYGSNDDLFAASSAPSDTARRNYTVRRYTAAADGSLSSQVIYSPPVPQAHLASVAIQGGVLGYSWDWAPSTTTTVNVVAGADAVSTPWTLAPGWELPAAGSGLPAGTLVQVDNSGKQLRTVDTGGGCAPEDFQTSQHWLYWNCGASAPSGVYDLDSGARIPLPSRAPYTSRISDGFLVGQDPATGVLLLTDFHTGTASSPVAVGTAPVQYAGGPGIDWAVDASSGLIAYESTSDRAIHVVDPGVPHSAVTASAQLSGVPGPYIGSVNARVSQPVDGWRATVVRRSTGQVVARTSGGPAHAQFTATWNGAKPYNGMYDWSISVLPRGGSAYLPVATQAQEIIDGVTDRHVYSTGARPDLLAMRTARGGSTWWTTNDAGRTVPLQTPSCHWSETTEAVLPYRTLIPISHQTGNWSDDLLAIDAAGILWWYPTVDTYSTCPEKAYAVRVGPGWGQYTQVVSPGDLNGDGRDDLVARDASGTLWFYAGRGNGRFAARVRIGGGWNIYTHLVGVGDLTGSGYGSLLAVDGAGVLWRYDGNGHGGFHGRVRIGGGWGQYNDLVGIGDWNQDGSYDLLARDRNGVLWFYDGTGHGTFRPRSEISGGWGGDWGLF